MAKTSVGFSVILFVVQCQTTSAQSLSLSGRVSDDTGRSLPGVSVQLRTADAMRTTDTVTDDAGQYWLDSVHSGPYEVRFSLLNFGPVTKQLTVAAGQAAVLDIVLPLAFTANVTVTGHRAFRSLADVDNAGNLIGLASAASEGAVQASRLDNRPLVRPADVLETVPGLVISQHSGEGKANQYYLRGFNLDHGTDFAVTVAGMPVNMPTHGHGQGWSDVNFLIPELIGGIQFKKGPYYADEGDFSTAGAASINYVSFLERPLIRLTTGGGRFGRMLAAASPRLGAGHLLVAFETGRNDGPWENPDRSRKLNGVIRFSQGNARQRFSITAMGYDARWSATDQVPRRAIENGLLSPFGTIDASDGGQTHRYSLSAEMQRLGVSNSTKVVGYMMDDALDLFSNFTYRLNDPVNGDQFEQVDERRIFGGRASHSLRSRWMDRPLDHTVGVQLRHDRIGALGLYSTRQRERLAAIRTDSVDQTSAGFYYQADLEISRKVRGSAGLRGDIFRFAVRSDKSENSGSDAAGVVSPKFGIAVTPFRTLELYGNFGFGYHSNDARGVTLSIDPITRQRMEPVTPLVRTRGGEFGVRTTPMPSVQTTVAVWGLALDSELVFVGDAGTTEASRPSRRMGVEWTNEYRPLPWLTLDADLSWSSARFTDADPSGSAIPGAIRRVAAFGASISEHRRMAGGVRLRYLGPRPLIEDASAQSGRSFLVNAEAGYRITPRTRLLVDVLNVFDSRDSDIDYYYASRLPGEPSEGIDDIHTHPLQPRTARVSIQFDF